MTDKATIRQLMTLTEAEVRAFQLIRDGQLSEVENMIEKNEVRVNCLDQEGMNMLDQACYRGDDDFVEFILEHGGDVDNRAHPQGYTCLMFAAMSGKAAICRRLLEAGARSHAINAIGKTASELAAFVGQHECVTVINSYINLKEVDKIVHPNGAESSVQYPSSVVEFIYRLTRTHEIHPVRLAMSVMGEDMMIQHRKVIVNTISALFDRQLRGREPNEIMSVKLWIIFFTLNELLKFIDEQLKYTGCTADESPAAVVKAIRAFIRNLLAMLPEDKIHPNTERFLRTAMNVFPYKQSVLYQAIVKMLCDVPLGQPPAAFFVICQQLFGFRYVQTAIFCSACCIPSASKRCSLCKCAYCSVECQKLDWPFHKIMCPVFVEQRQQAIDAPRTAVPPVETVETDVEMMVVDEPMEDPMK